MKGLSGETIEKSFRKFLEQGATTQSLEQFASDVANILGLDRMVILRKKDSGCKMLIISDVITSHELRPGSEECRWLDLDSPIVEGGFMALPTKYDVVFLLEGIPKDIDRSTLSHILNLLEMAVCIYVKFAQPLYQMKMQYMEAKKAHTTSLKHISKMTHDLKTPLATIIASAELLLAGSMGEINDKQRKYLEIIKENSYQLHVMLDDLLDLARLQLGAVRLEIATFSLKKAISETIKLFEGQLLDKKLKISVDFRMGNEYVSADKRRVKQILYNLLSNSVKFTPSGGSIYITAEDEGKFAKITVQDTGIGFADKFKDNIFEEIENEWANLQQLSSSELPGLGLLVVKRLVELHGGRIWAKSLPEGGSKFVFLIPKDSTTIRRS